MEQYLQDILQFLLIIGVSGITLCIGLWYKKKQDKVRLARTDLFCHSCGRRYNGEENCDFCNKLTCDKCLIEFEECTRVCTDCMRKTSGIDIQKERMMKQDNGN